MYRILLTSCSLIAIILFSSLTSLAQSRGTLVEKADSTFYYSYYYALNKRNNCYDKRYNVISQKLERSKSYEILKYSIPLMATAAIAYPLDDNFFMMRNAYAPNFRHHYDDYLQYAPAGLMLALKTFGVKGRSSWGRMLTADAFAAINTTIFVNVTKQLVSRTRPDNSAQNSFPSGHTATAFTTATMLHKEYGQTVSPIYSVLGYSAASITGVSRMLNNKHWMSDILAGAGIGILSTELAYYFADLIFKEKGLKLPLLENVSSDYFNKPDFFRFSAGYTFMSHSIYLGNGIGLKAKGGVNMSLDGAWFWSQNFGLGLKTSVISSPFTIDDEIYLNDNPNTTLSSSPLKDVVISPTAYFSYPLCYGFLIGANASPSLNVNLKNTIIATDANGNTSKEVVINSEVHNGFEVGASITKSSLSSFGFSLFVNYNAIFAKTHGSYKLSNGSYQEFEGNRAINAITVGASATAYFFKENSKRKTK